MKNEIEALLKHRKKYYSQTGEDGFLEFVLSKIPNKTNWCVEFGAWDGIHLSNTYYFIKEKGYKAVLIEGESDRHQLLAKNMEPYGATCINCFVEPSGLNSLDNILKKTPIPKEFDLLSIDIDSVDYQVWESLSQYQPKVVIIEINYRDKPGVHRINKPGAPFELGVSGSSISSITELAKTKGYSLIANIFCNAVYIQDQYRHLFISEPVTPEDVFLYEGHRFDELTSTEKKHLGAKRTLRKYLGSIYRKIVGKK